MSRKAVHRSETAPSMKGIARRPSGQFVHVLKRVKALWPFGYKRILLLDDDTSMQKLVAKLLKSLHARVDLFGDGRAVIARIATKIDRYDVLLLDLMMPHEGGMTVIRHLREKKPELLQRAILLTASPESLVDTVSRHVPNVVHKPFKAETLIEVVRRVSGK